MTSAVVVGSGPNGLTAAALLARAGVAVTVLEAHSTPGGGARTAELTVPGLLHDVCAAVHPLGVASPVFRELELHRHGLRWRYPELDLVHPLDGGRAAVLSRSVADTAAGLGSDGAVWSASVAHFAPHFAELLDEVLVPAAHLPRHPALLAAFGARALLPAAALTARWRTPEARALFAGSAAHAFRPLTAPGSASVGLLLSASAHAGGWPVAEGGTAAVVDALLAVLHEHGGRVETGRPVTSLAELDGPDLVLLDVSPQVAAELAGDALPARVARAYRRYRRGPGVFKVDLAVQGGVPWTHEAARRAGTLHLGGSFEEIAAAERAVTRGHMPRRPFVLVAQQYLADPSRSAGDVHPVWAYAHVPHGWDGDATDAVLAQLERFAPGTRERVVGLSTSSPAQLAAYNANYAGGDIGTGANDLAQLLLRPRPAVDPYATGIPGVYLCSAATPPGAGVHGMCGANAAASALRHLAR